LSISSHTSLQPYFPDPHHSHHPFCILLLQDAREAWEQAAAHADPTSDLDLILQINEALAGVGGSISSIRTSTAAAAAAPAAAATPALKAVPHATDEHATAAPQPQKTAEAGIAAAHANGVIAAGQTSVQPASSSTAAAKQPAAASAAADAGKSSKAAPATKAFKGFLKPVPGGSKPISTDASATGAANSSSAAAAAAARSSSKGSSSGDAALEIDCAAEQQKQQRAVPASFGEQVAQQQQSSVMLTIAITQVRAGGRQKGGLHVYLAASPVCSPANPPGGCLLSCLLRVLLCTHK
jgi:hypothetical protein